MVSINGIAGDTTLLSANLKKIGTSAFEGDLTLAKAESLLKNTNQYVRWRGMRQNNPVRAKEVADLVLERCRLLHEARCGREADVKKFDGITEQLRRKGIHLFKSHQFREPVFDTALRSSAAKSAASTPSAELTKTPAAAAPPGAVAHSGLPSGILPTDPLLLWPEKATEVAEARQVSCISKSPSVSRDPIVSKSPAASKGYEAPGSFKASRKSGGADNLDISKEVVQLIRDRYLGKQYRKRDCYVFLVRALEDVGVRYYGSGGLKETLLRKAAHEGRQKNAYLTGEGVIESICENPSKIHIPRAGERAFTDAWRRLKGVLSPGALISVSSRRFGHTGIVGNKGDEWTLLNSARQVYRDESGYKVKEENLEKELKSWLRRAHQQRSFLTVTVGNPETKMAVRFGPDSVGRKVG